jgi:hypothetical protein
VALRSTEKGPSRAGQRNQDGGDLRLREAFDARASGPQFASDFLERLLYALPLAGHRGVDAMIEYAIFKMYRTPEYWDGPYKTLKAALADFKKSYANAPEQSQDFAIFKIITTKVKTKWVTKKSKPRRASR